MQDLKARAWLMFLESKEEYNTKRESKELMVGDSERKNI